MIFIFLNFLIDEDLQTSELVTFVAKDHKENKEHEDEHIPPSGISTPKAVKKKKKKNQQDEEEQEGNRFSI